MDHPVSKRLQDAESSITRHAKKDTSIAILCDVARQAVNSFHARDAEITGLRAELERERTRLAACGVVAMADTPDSAVRARTMHPDYESASCRDVARRVDECIRLRAENAAKDAECEGMRKDAERYGYISTHFDVSALRRGYNDLLHLRADPTTPSLIETMGLFIDAAMKENQPQ